MKKRIQVSANLEIDLDKVPGFGHTGDNWLEWIKNSIEGSPSYNKEIKNVSFKEVEGQSFRIKIDFKMNVDLDMFLGAYHQGEDWCVWIEQFFQQVSHYHPDVKTSFIHLN